eukprot:8897012-Alexandrium_andersonii.AAC.2
MWSQRGPGEPEARVGGRAGNHRATPSAPEAPVREAQASVGRCTGNHRAAPCMPEAPVRGAHASTDCK